MITLQARFSTKIDWRIDKLFSKPDYIELVELDGVIHLQRRGLGSSKISTQLLLDKNKNYKISFKTKDDTSQTPNDDWDLIVGGKTQTLTKDEFGTYQAIYTELENNELEIVCGNFCNTLMYDLQVEEMGYSYLDIIQDSVALTKELQDLKEFTDKSSEFSKDFELINTETNVKFFKNCFNITTLNAFNQNKKIKCAIYDDDVKLIDGFLALNRIIVNGNSHTYEVNVYGGGLQFFNDLKSKSLRDLDYTEMEHTFDYSGVSATWYEDGRTAQNAGFKYVYPEIDFNTQLNAERLSDGISLSNYVPVIYAKTYWDKIHEDLGYTYEGAFFETDEWMNMGITLDNFQTYDKELFEITINGDWENDNYPHEEVKVEGNWGEYFLIRKRTINDTHDYAYISDKDNTPDWTCAEIEDNWYQPKKDVGNTPGYYRPKQPTYSRFRLNGSATFLQYFSFDNTVQTPEDLSMKIELQVFRDRNRLEIVSTYVMLNEGVVEWEIETSEHLADSCEGLYFLIEFFPQTNYKVITKDIKHTLTNVDLVSSKVAPGIGIINIDKMVPDFKQIDFVKSITNMFNLYNVVDILNKKVTYYTYDEFYEGGEKIDWSEKLQRDKPYELAMSNEITSGEIILTHLEGDDIYSDDYSKTHGDRVMGDYRIDTGNEFQTDTYTIETIYAANVFEEVNKNMFITQLRTEEFDEGADEDKVYEVKIPTTPIVGFYKRTEVPRLVVPGIPLPGSVGIPPNIEKYTYYVIDENGDSHPQTEAHAFTAWLDPTNSVDNNIVLNFNKQPLVHTPTSGQPTTTLYTKYWRSFLNNYIDKDGRILTGYFDLNSLEYANIKLNETIYIDGTIFYINKIYDFIPGELKEVEFVKRVTNPNVFVELDDQQVIFEPKTEPLVFDDPYVVPSGATITTLIDAGLDDVNKGNIITIIEGGENYITPFNPGAQILIDGGLSA